LLLGFVILYMFSQRQTKFAFYAVKLGTKSILSILPQIVEIRDWNMSAMGGE